MVADLDSQPLVFLLIQTHYGTSAGADIRSTLCQAAVNKTDKIPDLGAFIF